MWDVCEDASRGVEIEKVNYYLRLFRQKLMTLSPNGQEEFTLRNIFRNFDTNQNGTLNQRELQGLVSKLGVHMDDHELEALFQRLDENKNGCLEFEEFAKLVLEDPYK